MTDISLLHGQNAAFLDDLYRAYQDDPRNVPEEWQKFFSGLGKAESKGNEGRPEGALSQHLSDRADEQVKVLYLINANRYRGHREADLDPLRLHERPRVPDLRPEYYGFGESDMAKVFNTGSLFGGAEAKLSEIIALLEATYRGSIGTEITHITSTEQKRWIQERLESALRENWKTTCTENTWARSAFPWRAPKI
jgi:2-oxoglutarate dehydrogenase E1 component